MNERATAQRDPIRPGRVVAVMGSYRKGGTLDTVVGQVLQGARGRGAQTQQIDLVDRHIEFCRNCRECCQAPGPDRGPCVLKDDVDEILTALEQADAIVLGAPVNFGDVNALTRKLQERLLGYGYWPPGQKAPKLRRAPTGKPALLVTSSAAPGLMTRWLARPLRTLKQMARLLGARPVGSLIVGLVGPPGFRPNEKTQRKARALGRKLVSGPA